MEAQIEGQKNTDYWDIDELEGESEDDESFVPKCFVRGEKRKENVSIKDPKITL